MAEQLPVATLLAATLAGLLIRLSLGVIALRRRHRVSVGTGGEPRLDRAMRAQANLIEYGPLAVILTALAEWQGAPLWLLAPTALVFALGRAAHAYSFTREREEFHFRVAGMHMTIWPLMGLIVMAVLSLA